MKTKRKIIACYPKDMTTATAPIVLEFADFIPPTVVADDDARHSFDQIPLSTVEVFRGLEFPEDACSFSQCHFRRRRRRWFFECIPLRLIFATKRWLTFRLSTLQVVRWLPGLMETKRRGEEVAAKPKQMTANEKMMACRRERRQIRVRRSSHQRR
jgi:hypothetical protein